VLRHPVSPSFLFTGLDSRPVCARLVVTASRTALPPSSTYRGLAGRTLLNSPGLTPAQATDSHPHFPVFVSARIAGQGADDGSGGR
jgi:hypothetical protein